METIKIHIKHPDTVQNILIDFIFADTAKCDITDNERLFESYYYHTLCARATIHPGKTIDEVVTLLESQRDNFGKH